MEYNHYERDYYTGRAPASNKSNGYLSNDSMRLIKERVNYMVYISGNKTLRKRSNMPVTNYKLVFVTLTLSSTQIHSDHIIKSKLLQPFLRIMRNRWKVRNYLWKAEVQDNGNIHFHITSDKYIHWSEIRSTWNTIQETLGYITRSKIVDPNSTDIHAVYKMKNPAGYICGYISKKDLYKKENKDFTNEDHYYASLLNITACDLKTGKEVGIKRVIEGKLYDCNSELKKIRAVWEANYAMSEEIEAEYDRHKQRIRDNFFTVTFLSDLNKMDAPHLKYLLDRSIEYSYTATEGKSFANWLCQVEAREISNRNN